MTRLLELIVNSAAPPVVMHNAACGKLNVPPMERLEILVYLASNPALGELARTSLQSWEEQKLAILCGQGSVPEAVAEFFLGAGAPRKAVAAAILRNHAIPASLLAQLAGRISSELISEFILAAIERRSQPMLISLGGNRAALHFRHEIDAALGALGGEPDSPSSEAEALAQYEREHSEEIASQQHVPFELTLGSPDEKDELAELLPMVKPEAPASKQMPVKPEQHEQLSTLQKIAALTVSERVQLAMRGSREERMILIRDGIRVVAVAVLESPKVAEQEMESFASMKNVQEAVLRGIAQRRRFMKNYSVARALAINPRTPLEIALPLIKNLLLVDLRNLVKNRGVSEMVRRIATKAYQEKSKSQGQSK